MKYQPICYLPHKYLVRHWPPRLWYSKEKIVANSSTLVWLSLQDWPKLDIWLSVAKSHQSRYYILPMSNAQCRNLFLPDLTDKWKKSYSCRYVLPELSTMVDFRFLHSTKKLFILGYLIDLKHFDWDVDIYFISLN